MDKVKKIVSKIFKIKEVRNDMTSDDIEAWDSLGQLILINAIEKEFDIILEIEEIFQIIKIEDIYKVLKNKGIECV